MEKNVKNINRAYLETLSFSDLISLADEYGIDVPDDLNRGFLIADLLDSIDEFQKSSETPEMTIAKDDESEASPDQLPASYNTTEIDAVLRNPAWAFVYWNISEADSVLLKKKTGSSLMLRVCSLPNTLESVPDETFDVQIPADENEQYVLLPAGKRFIRVELLCMKGSTGQVLASSPVFEIPHGSPLLATVQPGRVSGLSPVLELSGMQSLLLGHYKNHRQSFS